MNITNTTDNISVSEDNISDVQDDITYAIIQTTIQQHKESMIRSILFWETDDKKLGLIIRILHHSFLYSMILWYFYIHLFSPSFFSLILFYIIFINSCIMYILSYALGLDDLEHKWTGEINNSLLSNLLEIFHIPLTQCNGVIILSTSIITVMLTFEIISRIIC